MKTKIWAVLALFLLPMAATAQGFRHVVRHALPSSTAHQEERFSYCDSLAALRDSIFGGTLCPPETPASGITSLTTAQLFLPLTFYKEKVLGAFSTHGSGLTDEQAFADSTLLRLYVLRPDLVQTTSSRLQATRSRLDRILSPIQTETEFTGENVPTPVEPAVAPVELVVHKPNFWTYTGDYSLQFMQNYVSGNWHKGGESNYSTLASVIMEAKYNNKHRLKWENKLEMRFGLQSSRSDSLHHYKTTEDLLRLTSKVGLQASKRWYYALQLLAYTQFTHSYKANDRTLYSDFLAPFNVNLSLGMDYSVDWLNHRLKGNIHLAPLAYNMKYTRIRSLAERLGIEDNRRFLNDFGSEFTVDLTWTLMEDFTWRTRLYGYTTYERAELEWENTLTLHFNRFISAQVFLYPRFDDGGLRDDHHGYFQFKEYASIGFNYKF